MQARQKMITAVLVMAVLLSALTGCIATKRDVQDIRGDIAFLRAQNDSTRLALQRLDSLAARNEQTTQALLYSLNTLNDEMQTQFSYLLENYNSLLTEVNRLRSQRTEKKLADSASADHACGQSFQSAIALMRDKKYDDAIVGFNSYLASCSTHVTVGDARYWIGECTYSQSKFADAIPLFENFITTFPASEYISRALYKIARCYQELDKKSDAKKRFQQIIDKYPESPEAKQSKERLKELK